MVANKTDKAPIALILAGGSGTRFWPMSRKDLPKQYLPLTSSHSLIQETVQRLQPLCTSDRIFIASEKTQAKLIKQQLPEIHNLVLEPLPKNTAACLMLSVSTLLKQGFSLDSPLMVFPADHAIGNTPAFLTALQQALSFVQNREALLTFGIPPTFPHTGYGYIECDGSVEKEICGVKRFTEKPNRETADQFLKAGNYFWNSGIFVWTLRSIVTAFEAFLSASWNRIHNAKSESELAECFKQLPAQPIDTAVLEKSSKVFVLPVPHLEWNDLGSWKALYDFKAGHPQENICLSGELKELESEGCLIKVSPDTQVALVGVKNLVVVQEGNRLLILDKEQDQKVKEISQQFER